MEFFEETFRPGLDLESGDGFAMSPIIPAPPLEIYLLSEVALDDVLRLQRRLVYEAGESGGGALVLCEHSPSISVGRLGSWGHIRADFEELRAAGIPVRWVNRGGGCVYHMPGQLAAYVILPLPLIGLNVREYVEALQRSILGCLADFDIEGILSARVPGIFLGDARVASLGIAVSRWVAYHGFTLNVGPYLEPFRSLLREPGPHDAPLRQTSMEARRQRPAAMSKVKESLIRNLETVFGLERHHLYTNHPMLERKAASHVVARSFGSV